MKNKTLYKQGPFAQFRSWVKGLELVNLNEVAGDYGFILRGALWGVAVFALIIGMANFKSNRDNRKMLEKALLLEDAQMSLATDQISEEISDQMELRLEEAVGKYIADYMSTHDIADFFSEETRTAFEKEIEKMILQSMNSQTTLTKYQQKEVEKIIQEKIKEIDYSKLEAELRRELERMGALNEEKQKALQEKLMGVITTKASEVVTQISSEMNSKYDELMAMIKATNGRITDKSSGEMFQYGVDEISGAPGYYYRGTFSPF